MSTDPLAELARRARGPAPDPAWDDLCRGELPEHARAALLASEGADALAPLFEPLDPATVDQLADRVIAARVAERLGPTGAAAAEPVAVLRPAPRGALVAFPRAREVMAGLALAAAVLLAVALPDREDALPGYTLEATFGDQATRGDGPTGPSVSTGSRVTLVARPEVGVEGAVQATARVRPVAGGAPVPWSGGVEVSPTGAVRLTGVLGADLALAPGAYVIEVVVTRPGGTSPAVELATPLTVTP